MAAHGSGAAARSIRDRVTVMNVDVGGGTSKIAICADGRVIDVTALDVGARLVCLDAAGRIVRIEEAGRRFAADLGVTLELGAQLSAETARALAARMADRLFEAMNGGSPTAGGAGLRRRLARLTARASPRSGHPAYPLRPRSPSAARQSASDPDSARRGASTSMGTTAPSCAGACSACHQRLARKFSVGPMPT